MEKEEEKPEKFLLVSMVAERPSDRDRSSESVHVLPHRERSCRSNLLF